MKIAVVGLGYVGLVTAAGFARTGHEVIGVERDPIRLGALQAGLVPIHEPGLETLLGDGLRDGVLRLSGTSAVTATASVVIVCVGTDDGIGGWQTATIEACLAELVPSLADDAVLLIRSTLPPSFVATLAERVGSLRREAGRGAVPVLLNPEFTSEGTAVRDFLAPDRILLGVSSDPDGHGEAMARELYAGFGAPILVQHANDACLTKIASNLFLATKISFANELARLCELYGAGVDSVVEGMAYDARIGGSFLRPGVGFGGSCLPHQVRMVVQGGREAGLPMRLLGAVEDVNQDQVRQVVDLLESRLGPLGGARIALLGLAFKPGTDDVREAPALAVAQALIDRDVRIVAYDPMVRARERVVQLMPKLRVVPSAIDALRRADAAVLVTEWPEFRQLDWSSIHASMTRPVVVDGRNALDAAGLRALGFDLVGFGLPREAASPPDRLPDVRPAPSRPDAMAPVRGVSIGGRSAIRVATEQGLATAELPGT